jgi:prepilin-type N-terminal cleavage/methylation domain-containing protein
MRPTPRATGFTLIELLVAIAVLAILIVAILGLLDSSQRVAKTESALADTQENVRYAAYHLLRTARMVGAANMPFAQTVGGNPYWLAARMWTDPGSFTDDFGTGHTCAPGSDVLVLRGFFEQRPYFVRPTDVSLTTSPATVTVREDAGAGLQDMDVVANQLTGLGLVLMGRGQYAVAQIAGNTAPTASNRFFTVDFDTPGAPWDDLNPNATYPFGGAGTGTPFDVYRVGILDSYAYYVSPDFRLMRVRAGNPPEPVAINIGSLQVAFGVDSNEDGAIDVWYGDVDHPADPTVDEVDAKGPPAHRPIAIRITVLGRTADPVPGWTEPPGTFAVEDLSAGQVDLHAKWRLMRVTATLRDYTL